MFAVLFGPLAFGGVEPWSLVVLQAAMFAMLPLGGLPRPREGMPREQAVLVGAVVFVILIGLLQRLQPVPGNALRPLGPFTASVESTGQALLLWGGYLCLALGAPRVLTSPESLRRLAWGVFLAGAAVSVIGILQSGQDNRILYGLREVGVMHKAFGPYYNRNHAAAVMAVSAVVGIGLFLSGFAEPGARRNLGALIDVSARNLSVIFLLGVLLLGLALSRSRGGANALAMGLVAGLFMSSRGRRIRSRWVRFAWKAAFGLAAIAYLVFLYWHPIYMGLTDPGGARVDGSTAIRLSLYRSGLRMFLDSPLTGWGLGAFAQAIPPYLEPKVALVRFGQAHNDWLQILLECGVIGFGVFACALLILLRSAARAWGSCPQPELRWLSHWIIAAALAMMFHSFVEFNLQIPANALIFFALLCWLAAPKPWRGGEEGLANQRWSAAPAVVAVGLVLAALRPAIAWRHAQEARAARPERRLALLEKAVSWDGGARYWFRLGFACFEAAVSKVPPDPGRLRQALGFSQRAVLADPFHPGFRRLHQAILWRLGRRADAQEFR